MFDKKLIFNIDKLNSASEQMQDTIDEMDRIQKALKKAMEDLVAKGAWHTDGSSAFKDKYEADWVEGINDRMDVMKRLKENIDLAITEYQPIADQCEEIKLEYS